METRTGITPSMILLALLVVSLSTVALTLVILNYKSQIRWMRIFSEKQGIPAIIMEHNKPGGPVPPKPDLRPRIHVPIPGGAIFKPSETRKIG